MYVVFEAYKKHTEIFRWGKYLFHKIRSAVESRLVIYDLGIVSEMISDFLLILCSI